MGIGGNFWDLLKPYVRNENYDFLRNKKVAIDLSYWIVQHETALKNKVRNPHLRVTFFRTINLFSKFGAFPVFVIDGVPSPLKARARIERFLRFSGVDISNLPKVNDGVSVERNGAFQKCVHECVELLQLLGMPVLKASCEAEALCAQLNYEGHVDACITADSDALLYGAKCVIKSLSPNSKEPFECYFMSDLETGLGLKRLHFVAISLLVGNDHNLGGVSGIGIETALRFVRMFPEDEILKRLHELGNGNIPVSQINDNYLGDCDVTILSENSPKTKLRHCSYCGHPGSKSAHSKIACEHCVVSDNGGCSQKPSGFKCECSSCNLARKSKERKKHESWQLSVCRKISSEKNFPNEEIIEMYLSHKNGSWTESPISLLWGKPKLETLVEFLGYHQHWDPSYIRQRILPMLSTHFLRDMVSNPIENLLLHGQYEFYSIKRAKITYGRPCYLVTWRKAAPCIGNARDNIGKELSDVQNEDIPGVIEVVDLLDEPDVPQILVTDVQNEDIPGVIEVVDLLDEPDVPQIIVDDGCSYLLTEENMELVQAAFPNKVERFLQEKELKSREKNSSKKFNGKHNKFETPKSSSTGIQLSIKEFYRATKALAHAKQGEHSPKGPEIQAKGFAKGKRTPPTPNLSKSARRRLLFD
ncbi:hypothetical protein AQUCO_01300437v1 [Aquilegia coerulea]|uniref:Flap endonuclease GEN-like 1 n=1 Tax=Aquilegia coerulea TaxID=218851 RepID=A0A2G5E1M1_AQUCA|nr:hypothetical protein AQUCO_01300437v1 [Aquilegia coerulea]